jgi:hypothetical protein
MLNIVMASAHWSAGADGQLGRVEFAAKYSF